jgi:hypothetical protein
MSQRKKQYPMRSADCGFSWVTHEMGPQWEAWRAYAAEWMGTQHRGISELLRAIRAFFEDYLHRLKLPAEPAWLLCYTNEVPDFFEAACPRSRMGVDYNNDVCRFLDWVLEHHFSKKEEHHGRSTLLPDYHNPFTVRSRHGLPTPYESVRSPLPYRFIRELREILAPGQHFREWRWAQEALNDSATSKNGYGDWFIIDDAHINYNDPDCVWRQRKRSRDEFEMWSPVRAMALLIKLMLPLRTFQVRMLDSGEADTWRYSGGDWVVNEEPLASGDERHPVQRGAFRRIVDRETGSLLTGLFINTNKTADIHKGRDDLGYVMPWQHNELFYWIEKLRNWQEKYNSIQQPTSWKELDRKHLHDVKSEMQLSKMPDTCFLVRDAAASTDADRARPLPGEKLDFLWYKILTELETRCATRNDTMVGGRAVKFVKTGSRWRTLYPLHSLRVSLLTCLALDAKVPLVVLSKLVAGHSRLVMTLYYTKVGIARMTQMMNEASEKLAATASEGLQRFLVEATYEQLGDRSIFNSLDSVKAALPERVADRNPVGWMPRHHGMCLVGGNTSPSEGNGRIGGCYNGGPFIRQEKSDPSKNLYDAVPGGAGNCVRCRWFVTEPRYIDALRSHFNNVSYHLAEAAKEAKTYEDALEKLKTRRYAAEQAKEAFSEQAEYLKTERLWESSLAKVDQLANDLTATYRLIRRCMTLIERDRENANGAQQLVAVGGLHDLRMAFEDTQSELLQLAGVCLDAELYPDESPGKAVVRRSQFLDSALYREGVQPVFLTLTEAEQLRLGNRFMSQLAAQARPDDPGLGLRRVVDILETGRSLEEIGVVDDMVEMLETELRSPLMRVSDITQEPRRRRIPEPVH